jgi:hypothetical protein
VKKLDLVKAENIVGGSDTCSAGQFKLNTSGATPVCTFVTVCSNKYGETVVTSKQTSLSSCSDSFY